MQTENSNSLTPFLFSYAVTRTPHPDIKGRYCPVQDLWVVDTPSGSKPIVQTGALEELVTKTLVQQESDDERIEAAPISELATKTKVETESDDEIAPSALLELATKTDHQLESDDQSRSLL